MYQGSRCWHFVFKIFNCEQLLSYHNGCMFRTRLNRIRYAISESGKHEEEAREAYCGFKLVRRAQGGAAAQLPVAAWRVVGAHVRLRRKAQCWRRSWCTIERRLRSTTPWRRGPLSPSKSPGPKPRLTLLRSAVAVRRRRASADTKPRRSGTSGPRPGLPSTTFGPSLLPAADSRGGHARARRCSTTGP